MGIPIIIVINSYGLAKPFEEAGCMGCSLVPRPGNEAIWGGASHTQATYTFRLGTRLYGVVHHIHKLHTPSDSL